MGPRRQRGGLGQGGDTETGVEGLMMNKSGEEIKVEW